MRREITALGLAHGTWATGNITYFIEKIYLPHMVEINTSPGGCKRTGLVGWNSWKYVGVEEIIYMELNGE